MIFQLALLALVAPLVCATITLQAPNGTVRSNTPATFTWTSSDNADPPFFSLVLQATSFHNTYAIANNVLTTSGSISLTVPTVPAGDGYTLQAVNISDINDLYSTYGPFSIAAALSTTASSTATGASSSVTLPPGLSTSSGASSAGTATGSGTVSPSTLATSAGTITGSTTGTQTANTGTSTPFNNGANQAASSYTALALSAFTGIIFLAL
ncbi:hypothetical protein M378DRAFT_6067 [Amanita muscaria Koide BX008]|uniref:Uncharacterized protein n=1 Tax=Amanita muscaria (strain Koide BX008) TaxID=946122 RepID=A0A0C2T5P4_AMAMK|nr:hypothetical protein M378DRAFT_6067 [Amanita muscaria Koide BX008]